MSRATPSTPGRTGSPGGHGFICSRRTPAATARRQCVSSCITSKQGPRRIPRTRPTRGNRPDASIAACFTSFVSYLSTRRLCRPVA
ncbi:hypothetical protein [Ornithinimicrobium kibberense]|uniref:hypothetical protein n=1 Tax=Ornithinimicrobium kibberense TaxID=282060 RepID=UPI00360D8A55